MEILKLLYIGADVLVLDEPTSFSTPQEVDTLFETIEKLIAHGKSIIFISHKLEEVLRISQRITVLSRGQVCGQMMTKDADKQKIIRMMIGENMETPKFDRKEFPPEERTELMRIEHLAAKDDRGAQISTTFPLTLHRGDHRHRGAREGNGQAEMAEVITGLRPASGGRVSVCGKEMHTVDATDFIDAGVSCVPADRVNVGSVKEDPLYQNWILRKPNPPKKGGLLNYRQIRAEAKKAIEDYDVRTTGIKQRSGLLSGGNMQKFILARELDKHPKVLVCFYPTRGLDIKATYFIRETIQKSRDEGVGVVLFSGEMEELFSISDRIIVLYKGRVVGEVQPEDYNAYEIGRMMMGGEGRMKQKASRRLDRTDFDLDSAHARSGADRDRAGAADRRDLRVVCREEPAGGLLLHDRPAVFHAPRLRRDHHQGHSADYCRRRRRLCGGRRLQQPRRRGSDVCRHARRDPGRDQLLRTIAGGVLHPVRPAGRRAVRRDLGRLRRIYEGLLRLKRADRYDHAQLCRAAIDRLSGAWADWRQGGVNPQSAEVPAVARLPKLISGTRAHVGLFIALACVAVYWFVCRYTQFGYNLRVVGKARRPRSMRAAMSSAIASSPWCWPAALPVWPVRSRSTACSIA